MANPDPFLTSIANQAFAPLARFTTLTLSDGKRYSCHAVREGETLTVIVETATGPEAYMVRVRKAT